MGSSGHVVTPASIGADTRLATVAAKTGNYTANAWEIIPVNTTGGAVTITLPAASSAGVQVGVILAAGTNTVTIQRAGSDTIDGATTSTIVLAGASRILVADGGTAWKTVAGHNMLDSLDARYGAGLAPDVQTFTASGTWSKPSGAVWVDVAAVGPGQGGGSGRRGANGTVRCGGGGGCGGATGHVALPASLVADTMAVTIPAPGQGGAAVSVDNTDGSNGTVASTLTVGGLLALTGGDGVGGHGGTATGGPGGGAETYGTSGGVGPAGTSGGIGGSADATGGAGGSGQWGLAPGGGAGGGINASNATAAGGGGGSITTYVGVIGYGGSGGVAGPGGAGTSGIASTIMTGSGGGGGGGGGHAGGAGGSYGAGGGGGGSSLNGTASGTGGNGGPGIVQITTWRSAASGTGSVDLYPIIRLKDGYLSNPGCAFDGSDELAKAQAIIDAAPAGSVVEFYPGTLGVSGTLKLKNSITYRGTTIFGCRVKLVDAATGCSAVMAAAGWLSAANPIWGENPVTVERIYIDGNKANTAGANPSCHGLVLMGWQSTARNVNIINTPGDGIHLADRTLAGVNLSNTAIENRIENCRIETPDGDGIHVESFAGSLTDGFLINNLVAAANGVAIRVKRGAGWLIDGNHVYTGSARGTSAIWVSAVFSTHITNNTVDYYGQYYPGSTQYCMGIRTDGLTGRGSIIADNVIAAPAGLNANNVYRHVQIEAGSGGAQVLVQFRNNEIQGSGGSNETGLYLYSPAGSTLTVREAGTTIRGVLDANLLARAGVGVINHRIGENWRPPSILGTIAPGLVPNTTGTNLYPHNSGSGVGGMLGDGGRVTMQRVKTIKAATDAVVEFGNFQTQQLNPGELIPPNSIRVRASLVYPFGTPKYVSSSMTYAAGTTYAAGDMVTYGAAWYVSAVGSNANHTPSTAGNESYWTLCHVVPLCFRGSRDVDISPGGTVPSDRAGIDVAAAANLGVVTVVEPLTRAGVPVGSVTTSVDYAAGTTYAAGDIVVSGGRYYESLQAGNVGNTPAAAGTAYWGAVVYPYGLTAYTASTANPDWLAITAAAAGGGRPVDVTTTPTTANTAATTSGYGPMQILMRPANGQGVVPVILGIGDSIFNGSSDGPIYTNEPGGYFSRAINGAYCHFRINKAGDSLRFWWNSAGYARTGRSVTKAHMSAATHAICELGTNDIASSTLAIIQVEILAQWWMLRNRGILTWQTTITPQTTSTDSWATVGNQTASTNFGASSVWSQLNDWIVGGAPISASTGAAVAVGTSGALVAGGLGHPLNGFIDISSAVCDATVTWAWKANATADGVHPTTTTYAAMAALVPIATIAATTPLPV